MILTKNDSELLNKWLLNMLNGKTFEGTGKNRKYISTDINLVDRTRKSHKCYMHITSDEKQKLLQLHIIKYICVSKNEDSNIDEMEKSKEITINRSKDIFDKAIEILAN